MSVLMLADLYRGHGHYDDDDDGHHGHPGGPGVQCATQ